MDKANQMEFLFEEGGMADDGLDRDPVSGNEVPSGSMSEEVRDDIPAQLSEGEYVVPADVVRFFGVKYFEDLRKDAKMGLTQMEQEGRIGGEPVDVEGDDTELTAEEQAELDAIMGMAEGGAVTTTYDRLPPQAVGNTGQEQQLANVEQQMTRAFQEGGAVSATTQVNPDFSNFGAGYSFGVNPATGQPYTPPVAETGRNVTLYGPQGQVVNLILPQEQARYDELVAQGYSETPVAAPVAPQPQVQQQQDDGPDGVSGEEFGRALSGFQTGTYDEKGRMDAGVSYLSNSQLDMLMNDPLAYGRSELDENFGLGRKLVAGIGMVAPVVGLLGGIGMANAEASALNRAMVAHERAVELNRQTPGRYTAEELTALENDIEKAREKAGFLARTFPGSGRRQREELEAAFKARNAILTYEPPANVTGVTTTRGAILDGRAAYLSAKYGGPGAIYDPGASYTQDQLQSGYTGSGIDGVAMGKISGEGQVEGVVAQTRQETINGQTVDVPYVVKDENQRTVYKDEQGRSYVRTGLLGRGRDYLSDEEAAAVGVENNQNAPAPSESDSSGEGGSVICTALFNKGLLSKEIFMLDTQYGLMLESSQPEVTYGYRKMATPLATYIQKDTLGATIVRTLVAPVAKTWANEMAHQMQPENYKGNLLGKAIIKLGYPVCAFVGKRSKEIVYGT